MSKPTKEARNTAARRYWNKHHARLLAEQRLRVSKRTPEQKAKLKAQRREYFIQHHDEIIARQRLHRQSNKAKVAAQKAASAKRCRVQIRTYHREWDAKNRERNQQANKNYRWRVRLQAIAAYGGRCNCCGEEEPHFLTIDHIHNDGAIERAGNRWHTGTKFYLQLKRAGWPRDRYQLLCFNCNCAKASRGECPHQTKKAQVA